MAIEIERRFLIKNDNWKKFITKKIFIEQGYLSQSLDDWIIRIRFTGKDFKIALKKHIESFTNFEYEYSIPRKDGETIMANLSNTIKKERFFLEVEKKSWIIDCFKENNYPLEIAEIELLNEEEDLILPSFISKEITGLKHYSNFSLSNKPFSEWKQSFFENPEKITSQRNLQSFIFSLYLNVKISFLQMYGLYDKEGILRFVDTDKEACIAYAELFELGSTNYCLMNLASHTKKLKDTNFDQSQEGNNN